MIYQEQVMQIAQVLSGYTLGGADLLRRAMGKKIQAEMDAQRASFVEGAEKNGVKKDKASSIFDQVDKFAGYGFNKSHAAAYALVCYQTAYLKANHPVEFFAATMTLDMGNVDKLNGYRRDLEKIGVELLPPDVTRSTAEFTVERTPEGKKAIRYALAAIKGVGREAMARLAAEREENGPFKDLFDFAERLDQRVLNKRLVESLVKAGAFDTLNKNRAQTFGAIEALMRHSQATHESRGSNQNSLFGDDTAQRRPQLPKVPDWAPMERLQQEFSAIGFYLSSHPLAAYDKSLQRLGVTRAADLPALLQRGTPGRIKLAGTVIDKLERTSAKGNRFAFVQCSDQSGAFELTVFSEVLSAKRNLLEAGTGGADLGRRAARRRAGQADGADRREARGRRRQFRRRAAHRDLRSRRARGAAQVARRQARPRAGHAGRADGEGGKRGRGDLARHLFDRRRPARHHRQACRASPRWRRFEPPARPVRTAGRAQASEARAAERCGRRGTRRCCRRRCCRPTSGSAPRRGSFPGWRGLVYDGVHPQTALSKKGLAAYAQIPLLRTVSLDRTFYAPITTVEYARYAAQVPDHFSFVVKAPALVCDAVMRDEQGRGKVPNPHFLDPAIAAREFVVPCLEGLGAKAGPLVFQVSPLPRGLVEEAAIVVERLAAFFAALPGNWAGAADLCPGAAQCRAADAAPDADAGRAGGALLRRPARPHARGRAPGEGARGARRRHAG